MAVTSDTSRMSNPAATDWRPHAQNPLGAAMNAAQIAQARAFLATGETLSMEMQPCTCKHARPSHSGAKGNGKCSECGCLRFRGNTAYELAVRVQEAERNTALQDIATWLHSLYPRPTVDEGGLDVGPSDHGNCRRQIYLRNVHPEVFTDPVDENLALLGEIWHDVITQAKANLYDWIKTEVVLRLREIDRDIRCDLVNTLLLYVEDIKTCGPYAWKRIGDNGPEAHHWKQIHIYAKALRESGIPIRTTRLRYIDRATGQEELFEMPYDEALAADAINDVIFWKIAIRMRDEAAMPRDGSGPTSDAKCREYCAARSYCWNIPAAEAAGMSPECYTIIGPDPDPELIEQIAATVREWGDLKNETARQYKATVPILQGAPPGTYGIYVVEEKTREMPDYKRYYEEIEAARLEWLSWPEDTRGDLADWISRIELHKRIDTWTEVSLVRAAKRPKKAKSGPPVVEVEELSEAAA